MRLSISGVLLFATLMFAVIYFFLPETESFGLEPTRKDLALLFTFLFGVASIIASLFHYFKKPSDRDKH